VFALALFLPLTLGAALSSTQVGATFPAASASAAPMPHLDHVFLIMEENNGLTTASQT
jgi:hypothetical protein